MVYILSNFENSENRYKEVTSPMSGYPGQSKDAYYQNTILICLANAGCLADPQKSQMRKALNFILLFAQDPKNPKKCLSLTFMETLKLAFP